MKKKRIQDEKLIRLRLIVSKLTVTLFRKENFNCPTLNNDFYAWSPDKNEILFISQINKIA